MRRRCPPLLPALLLGCAVSIDAAAQGPPDSRISVHVKGGLSREDAEDGLRGTVGAGGLAVGVAVTPSWTVEGELWVPGAIRSRGGPGAGGDATHRDMLASGSAVRVFGARRVRPFALAGISLARTTDHVTTCIADRVPPGAATPVRAVVSCSEPDVRERLRERFTSLSQYVVGGVGVRLALGSRVRFVPELRMHAAPTSVIVRASAGIAVEFGSRK
jgi:hypothetical protein